MRRQAIGISTALGAIGIAGLVVSGIAGGDPSSSGQVVIAPERKLGHVAVERVERAPAGPRFARAVRARGRQKLQFLQTDPLEVAPQTEEGATLACPRRHRALSGYYFTGRAGTFLDLTAPEVAVSPSTARRGGKASKRRWVISVFNSTAQADQAILGVVCVSRLK